MPHQITAKRLQGMPELDPQGMLTPESLRQLCAEHECAEIIGQAGRADLAYAVINGVVWVIGAAGQGAGMCAAIDADLAELPGARAVAFQTRRPGLVRVAERLGYRVTGYILRRDL